MGDECIDCHEDCINNCEVFYVRNIIRENKLKRILNE